MKAITCGIVMAFGILVASSAPAQDTSGPGRMSWRIAAINGEAAAGGPTMRFGSDGVISGRTGCNSYRGAAEFAEGTLTMTGPVAATLMACLGDGLQQQERSILGTLEGTVSVEFDPFSDVLTLKNTTSETVLTLIQQ
jgi:heat shock protein HslJ